MTPAERKLLKAKAHALEPVVIVGGKGLTDEVVNEVDRALKVHELIKVRAPGMDRKERAAAFESLCERTGAQGVQSIGKVLVLFRKKDEQT